VATIEVDEGNANESHRASAGDHVVIRLAETPTSGYRWQVDDHDPAALQPAGDDFVPAADARTGGGGTREFRFVVVNRASSHVSLSLRRGWETGATAAQHFRTTIN
jgi:inhibitor of cysteine peptidase